MFVLPRFSGLLPTIVGVRTINHLFRAVLEIPLES
jgi:hypothetical protein